MFKNVLIFFSTLFFFILLSFELNSLTRDQVLKIKQKAIVVNSVVTKTRSKKFKLNIEASDDMSWSRVSIIEIEDVLEIPGQTKTGIYNLNTGIVE